MNPPSPKKNFLKVLHINSGNLFGGVESILITLAREQKACLEMQPEFALCFEGLLKRRLQEFPSPVYDLGEVRFRYPWKIWQARKRLHALLQGRTPNTILCHSPWPYVLFGPVAKQLNIPLVLWLHNEANNTSWLNKACAKITPNLIICDSKFVNNSYGKIFNSVPSFAFHYPMSNMNFSLSSNRSKIRIQSSTSENDIVIIQHCRLEEWKGHQSLLNALGKLKDLSNWTLWQVGGAQRPHEKRYLKKLKNLSGTLGIEDRVRWLGQSQDIPALLNAADIHCQPNSGPEPFGVAFIEALYAGLPSVSTSIGGTPEIIDPSCGILVEAENHTQLASELERLIKNPSLRKALGSKGPEKARSLCDPSHKIPELYHLLQTIL